MSEKDAAVGEAAQADHSAEENQADGLPAEGEAGGGSGAEGGDNPAEAIEALRRQAEEHWNNYLRSVAELDNLRKRNAREVENARKFGIERFVSAILPVRDSIEAGLKVAGEVDPGTIEVSALLEGEQATLRLLDQAFESAGIREIDPEGEIFDPEKHEAMSMLPSPTAEPGSVIAVVQKGYVLHERVIRPARVVVARAPTEPDSA